MPKETKNTNALATRWNSIKGFSLIVVVSTAAYRLILASRQGARQQKVITGQPKENWKPFFVLSLLHYLHKKGDEKN